MTNEKILRQAEQKRAKEQEYREKRLLIAAALLIGGHSSSNVIYTANSVMRDNDALPVVLRPEEE
jgi:hypothetical protein